jgi:hypothetical protein
MAEECTVVQRDFPVQRDQTVVSGEHQRIDLCQGGVAIEIDFIERMGDFNKFIVVLPGKGDAVGDLARLIVAQPQERVYGNGDDFLWGFSGHLLDLNAACAAGHQHHPAASAIECGAQVNFFLDVGGLIHEDLFDSQPLDVHAKNLIGQLLSLICISGQFDSPSLSSTADQYLAFHHNPSSQAHGDLARFSRCCSYFSFGNRYAIPGKDTFRLILVKVQTITSLAFVWQRNSLWWIIDLGSGNIKSNLRNGCIPE